MFKGLKSKLEDEAKRLQASVSQYGENIAQQMRNNTSDAGSDISGYTKRLFGAPNNTSDGESKLPVPPELPQDETIISLDDEEESSSLAPRKESSLMHGFDEADVLAERRIRRLSDASMASDESTFSTFTLPQCSSAVLQLDTINSDVESNAGSIADSTSFENAPKEQLGSIFQKLRGRATDYKQKYREVAKAYQDLTRENEKYRTVLTTTQDKALQRIDKLKREKNVLSEKLKDNSNWETKEKTLQQLLEKCKDRITANKQQISSLTEENYTLKQKLQEQDNTHSSESTERVIAEWKGRVDRLEEEWTKRLASVEEKAAISIATSKAEMHATINNKDQELEKWINKCHGLEKKDADANQRWQSKVEELNKTILALESEKSDMLEKLSKAKQEGVKDEEWRQKMKGYEDQMQLAIEEKDMQKTAALAEENKRIEQLNVDLEQLKTENLALKSKLEEAPTKTEVNKIDTATSAIITECNTAITQTTDDSPLLDDRLFAEAAEIAAKIQEYTAENEQLKHELATVVQDFQKQSHILEEAQEKHQTEIANVKKMEEKVVKIKSDLDRIVSEKEEIIGEYERKLRQANSENEEKQKSHLRLKESLTIENAELLKSHNEEMESVRQKATDTISGYNATIQDLNCRLAQVQSEKDELLSRKEAEITYLQSRFDALQNETKEVADLLDKIEQLTKAKEELVTSHNEELASIKLKATETISGFNATIRDLNSSLAQMQREKDELINQKEAELNALQSKMDMIQNETNPNTEFISKIENLNKEREVLLKSHNEELKAVRQKVSETASEYASTVEKLNIQISEIIHDKDETIQQRDAELNSLMDKYNQLKNDAQEQIEMAAQLEQLDQEKQNLVKAYEKELNDIRGQTGITIKECKATVENLNHKLNQLANEKDELVRQKDSDLNDLATKYEKLKQVSVEVNDLKTLIGLLNEEKEKLGAQHQVEMETARQSHSLEIKELQSKLADTYNLIEEAATKHSSTLEEKERKIRELQVQISQIQTDTSNTSSLEERIKSITSENNKISDQCTELSARVESLQQHLTKKEKEAEQLSSQLRDMENESKKMDDARKSELESIRQKKQHLQKQNTEMKEQLTTFRLEHEVKIKQCEELERRLKKANENLAKATSLEEAQRNEVAEITAYNERLLEQKQIDLKSISTLEKKIKKLEAAKQENEVKNQKHSELEATHRNTLNKLAECEASLDNLKKCFNEVVAEKDEVIEQKDNENKALSSKTEKLPAENATLRKRLATTMQKNEQLTKKCDELEALADQVEDFPHEKAELMKQVDSLKQRNTELVKKCEFLEHYHNEFAQPTEAEYLKNVLWRYMMERENLGKEIVTLAKVIGTVVKFTNEQLDMVVKKEENRHNRWLKHAVS
ncbi:GRIP domain-containing protein [Ditylenchus destructor]|uniref:GRIP domain-containing protein n=1 Tax=Ditylenchus destructor TaxID=166010 RepID=A0AAD4RBP8_9BILA|nr:GRIP domain-containing protein [Ditylenchus destructor]